MHVIRHPTKAHLYTESPGSGYHYRLQLSQSRRPGTNQLEILHRHMLYHTAGDCARVLHIPREYVTSTHDCLLSLFADNRVASKITLEEVSIVFDGKHAVHNDLLAKQEEAAENEQTQGDEKGTAVEHQEVGEDAA
jgi:hypothetical protein